MHVNMCCIRLAVGQIEDSKGYLGKRNKSIYRNKLPQEVDARSINKAGIDKAVKNDTEKNRSLDGQYAA